MRALVNYFINRPVVANAIMFGLIAASVIIWQQIGKEEYPEFAMNSIRINLRYPGASGEDVELFVTKPIEEKLKGLTGLREVTASSSYSSASFRISFEPSLEDLNEKIQEVKDAVDSVDFPNEVDEPTYRQFKSSTKAIIDIGIYLKDVHLLDTKSRQILQSHVLGFKNRLLTVPEISGVDVSGYLRPELQVKISPDALEKYEISMEQVKNQIISQNVRRPIGNMQDERETEVTLISELNDIESLKEVTISSGFQGQRLKLGEIANIEEGLRKQPQSIKFKDVKE